MNCREAKTAIKDWMELNVLKAERRTNGGEAANIEEAFSHIFECHEDGCHDLWRKFNGILIDLGGQKLLTDEEGLLPFSC